VAQGLSLGPHDAYFRMRTCAKIFSTRTVDTFATCDFNFRMRKYAQCGPRLILMWQRSNYDWMLFQPSPMAVNGD